jgi:hypothetical protein
MFHSLPLSEAFEHLATPEEWRWFGPMVARGAMHFGVDGWPLFTARDLAAYQMLRKRLAAEALRRLRTGEWIASGISPATGPSPVSIDTTLWDYLEIVDRVEEAKGAGFHFIALTVTEHQPTKVAVAHYEKATLRSQLTSWIKVQTAASSEPIRKWDLRKEARAAFQGRTITDNMFRDAWRGAAVPGTAKHSGRPKA